MKKLILRLISFLPIKLRNVLSYHLIRSLKSYFHYSAVALLIEKLGVEKVGYLDIGARRGVDIKHWAYRSFLDFVLFEPDPVECKYLQNYYNDVRNLAISSKSGSVELKITEDPGGSYTSNNSLAEDYYSDEFNRNAGITGDRTEVAKSVLINSKRLDECNILEPIAILKIDVQGEELSVLEGLGELRPACLKVEISSMHSHEKRSQLVDILEWCRSNNYALVGTSFQDKALLNYKAEFETSLQGDYYFIDSNFEHSCETQILVAIALLIFGHVGLAMSVLTGNPISADVRRAIVDESVFEYSFMTHRYNNAHDQRQILK